MSSLLVLSQMTHAKIHKMSDFLLLQKPSLTIIRLISSYLIRHIGNLKKKNEFDHSIFKAKRFGAQFQKLDWIRTWRMTLTLIGPQTILFPISNLNIAAFWPGWFWPGDMPFLFVWELHWWPRCKLSFQHGLVKLRSIVEVCNWKTVNNSRTVCNQSKNCVQQL